MINTLGKELKNTFAKQFFATIIFIIGGTFFIPQLPFGFTDEMLGIYRVLCVGYAFYASGNCIMLMSLYFSDYNGALIDTLIYALAAVIGTILEIKGDARYYGFGFFGASAIFTAVSIISLNMYISRLSYHVISKQPLMQKERKGIATRISEHFEEAHCEK